MGARQAGPYSLILWVAALALVWLSLAAPPPFHDAHAGKAGSLSPITSAASLPTDPSPADPSSGCPLCREAEDTGPLLLPAPISFNHAPLVSFDVYLPHRLRVRFSTQPRPWQSRAPPLDLHA
ncbi:hypothetical protein BDW16_0497 [Sphingomonas koreensis]|nr:hypothetical protein BDW16_0497 [Sphingomonas koreensis]